MPWWSPPWLPVTTARHPVPADGATITATAVELQWDPGMISTSSNVYFGEDFEKVSNATTTGHGRIPRQHRPKLSFKVGSAGNPYPAGLAANTTYYWRIDEVNDLQPDSPWKGEVWSFTVASNSAFNPDPVDGTLFVDPNALLTWTPGSGSVCTVFTSATVSRTCRRALAGPPKAMVPEPNYAPGMLESQQDVLLAGG